jgi:outer membrane protein
MFLEDSIRPYVGFNVAYEAYFTSNYTSRFSFSPMAGIEFFVSENFSLGPQLEYHLLVMLNTPGDGSDNPEHGLVGVFKIAWYF